MSDATRRKRADLAFRMAMDRSVLHIRVPDHTLHVGAFLVGMAADMHGPDGCCTDCHGRTPETREVAS